MVCFTSQIKDIFFNLSPNLGSAQTDPDRGSRDTEHNSFPGSPQLNKGEHAHAHISDFKIDT